jgi:hypothetical protein
MLKNGTKPWKFMLVALVLAELSGGRAVAQKKLEAEVVALRDGGFYPAEIKRPQGQFLLVVKNRSRADRVTIGIAHQGGASVVASEEVRALSREYLLDFPTGTYVVTDASHPNWSTLTITIH